VKLHPFLLSAAFIVLSFALATSVQAHQPRFVKDDQLVLIKNSEVSQAFYGELKGRAAFYLIDLKTAQELYFQILAPDLPGIRKDKTVTVDYLSDLGAKVESFLTLDPISADWQSFHEEYGGDNYLAGPSAKKPGEAGYYIVKISSPDNTGKYVLVAGEKETFSAEEIARALITIPQLKTKFFNKPFWQSFQGKVGKYFGLSFLGLVVFGYLFHRFRRMFR